jgi:glutamate 5-kinase
MRTSLKKARRIVIKVGSSLLADPEGGLQDKAFSRLARSFVALKAGQKLEVVLVSSGAVACGMKKMGFKKRPHAIAELQACAAVGQSSLIQAYEKAFAKKALHAAQVLLTRDDLENRRRYLNAKHTLNKLLEKNIIPIVNENDTVAVEEIKVGDNDTLAAFVSSLVDADLLILLTDCDGLYTGDPHNDKQAKRIALVENIDRKTTKMAAGTSWETRIGGMQTKVEAARMAGRVGIPTVIADGNVTSVVEKIVKGEDKGTLFLPSKSLKARKHWIAFASKTKGRLTLDAGAVDALVKKKRSLLATGIKLVKGNFSNGDAVDVLNHRGKLVARGLSTYSSEELEQIKGCKSQEIEKILGYRYGDAVINRDDLVIVNGGG